MSTFRYFAYGSNMLTERLRSRCPGARPCGAGVASGYAVEFQKRGTDGSAKASLTARADHQAYGVIFEIPESERRSLDFAEGPGYGRMDDLVVRPASAHPTRAQRTEALTTYLTAPGWRTTDLQPYDWYQALIVHGAIQHGLPTDYIDLLRSVPSAPDPVPNRPGFLRAQVALRAFGVEGVGHDS